MHTILAEGPIGLLSAHPDDHIPNSHLLEAARLEGVPVSELVYTRGENGINLRSDDPDFVRSGQRPLESQASATRLGIRSYEQYAETDNDLTGKEYLLAATAVGWVLRHNISTLVTLTTEDHPDHQAVADSAWLTAKMLLERNHNVSILELLPARLRQHADIIVPATPNSVAQAFGAVALNSSQFQTITGIYEDWPNVSGYSVEPASFERLTPYPLLHDAGYRLVQTFS